MRQVEQMREDGRVDMYAEADYSEGTTAYMWITNKIQKIADRIRDTEKLKLRALLPGFPVILSDVIPTICIKTRGPRHIVP